MNLSPHFTLTELTSSQAAARMGLDNTPPAEMVAALRRTAQLLEQVRTLLGKPVLVSSGYRSPQVNRAIGGAANSAHMLGCAADFSCPSFGSPIEICRAVADSDISFDQLIHEFRAWVHIAWAPSPRRQLLTIDGAGTRPGLE
jgi:zinc D-Ala-D-Ala carboxypeptidase